ncbi:MAG TPA: hypothetical protein VNL77_02150 [Roseiflexaceae bacterium]|nr:hypothetical protein [Roseiflexaceae bacterium]
MSALHKNWLEWSVFAAGLLLIACTVAFLLYEGARTERSPPQLRAEAGMAQRAGAHYLVPVTVTNAGGRTAQAVRVEVALERGGAPVEVAAFELDFVPGTSAGEGWAVFRSDPAAAERISARVVGFTTP